MSRHSQIADALGRADMADALGVGKTAVSNAVVRKRFPATWFLVLSDMCAGKGLECPPDLFDMRPLDGTQNVDGAAKSQGVGSKAREHTVNGAAE
jgi:hypothetical protein